MDISALYNVSSEVVKEAAKQQRMAASAEQVDNGSVFSGMLNTAIENLNTTNAYLSDAENEKIRFALGETENTHDLTIAMEKANTALQYTVAIRDKFLESYKEIMNMQI
ncbi:MAG: flagellar hook-basal body complex protein FliE [Lachnospiraceae bacterium]|nr:flagellar hook-basal body complex protein FliE [Lachnospiraceae bacterium]